MIPETERFRDLARENLLNTEQRKVLSQFAMILRALRDAGFASLPDEKAAMEKGREIRARTIESLPYLLERFEKNAIKAGAKVVWAKDADELNDFVLSLAREKGIKLCVKGKSMISEETGLREVLEEEGIETYETDLGEFIIQQAGRTPFHIVGPAINMTIDEVSGVFTKFLGTPGTDSPEELAMHARRFLREKFKNAGMGITGANMAVAETGSIILVENEGNIRYSTTTPKVHVALMSIEKVVPTMADAAHMLKLLTRSCTGQKISEYVSIITGPRKQGEVDGPDELYVVILDNGRTKIYQDRVLRGVLKCIRCGLCAAVCPIYTHIGGYAYGWVYSGPIGAVLNPLLLGLDKAKDLFHATTLCGACRDYCPAGVDIPGIMLALRARFMDADRSLGASEPPKGLKRLYKLWTWVLLDVSRYKVASRLMRLASSLLARQGKIESLPGRLSGWTESRDAPVPAPRTFHELYSGPGQERRPS